MFKSGRWYVISNGTMFWENRDVGWIETEVSEGGRTGGLGRQLTSSEFFISVLIKRPNACEGHRRRIWFRWQWPWSCVPGSNARPRSVSFSCGPPASVSHQAHHTSRGTRLTGLAPPVVSGFAENAGLLKLCVITGWIVLAGNPGLPSVTNRLL